MTDWKRLRDETEAAKRYGLSQKCVPVNDLLSLLDENERLRGALRQAIHWHKWSVADYVKTYGIDHSKDEEPPDWVAVAESALSGGEGEKK